MDLSTGAESALFKPDWIISALFAVVEYGIGRGEPATPAATDRWDDENDIAH